MVAVRGTQKDIGWPAAAPLIAAILGAAATAFALTITPTAEVETPNSARYATSREIGEVKARLDAIEDSSRQMRTETRDDIKELRELVQRAMKPQ